MPTPGYTPKIVGTPHGILRSIVCPDCGAGVGDPCMSVNDKPVTAVHRRRRHQTMRAWHEAQAKAADVQLPEEGGEA
jgi:hypothetical protein